MSSEIPLIPLTQPRPDLINSVRTACLTHGFFQITDTHTTIPPTLRTRLLNHGKAFFNLPESYKQTLAKKDHVHGGYERFQKYSLQASRGRPDLNEGYSVGPEFVDGESSWPDEKAMKGEGELVGFRETCREYYRCVDGLAKMLGGVIAEGLGLERSYFERYFDRQMAHLRLIHYRAAAAEEEVEEDDGDKDKNDVGAGMHTDWGLITILLQDDVGGLKVLDKRTQKFIEVPPTPGAFVVNCGDLLSRFTNNVYTSAQHMVVAPPRGVDRYSAPYFCDGNPDYTVDVLPLGEEWKEWVQGRRGNPVDVKRLYEPITAGEYFEYKWRESAGGGKGD